jgi:hypothetical protein
MELGTRMRTIKNQNWLRNSAAAALLAFAGLAAAPASALSLQPGATIEGIPPIGYPGFHFRPEVWGGGDYSNTIESWYQHMLTVGRSPNGVTYDLVAFNQGFFNYRADEDSFFAGEGNFYMQARFGPAGRLLSGRVVMTGRINSLGVTDPDTVLFTADIVDFAQDGRIAGFAIDNIWCNDFIAKCVDDPSIAESVYLRLNQALPNISQLGDQTFTTSLLANITTVPLPGSVWLMISGLCFVGAQAAHRRRAGTAA